MGGMSELCMYELEDNVWDEFGENDDHIVPHPADEYGDQFAVQADSRKKPRHEVIGVTSNADNVTKCGIQGKEEKSLLCMIKKDTMLEKGSWSHTPDGVCPALCDGDSVKEVTSTPSEDSRMSNTRFKSGNIDSGGNDICTNDPLLGDRSDAADDNLYSLSQISQTDNDLSFFDNDREDKESNDLFYGWPDIGNFEDVDRMFRSCDSTFGLGSLSNEDDLCWFSSSLNEESADALKSDSKLKSISEHHEASRPNNAGPSTDDSSKKSVFTSDKISFRITDVNDATLDHLSSPNVSDTKSQIKEDLMPDKQINLHKKQPKHLKQSERKRKDQYLENGVSFHHRDNSKQLTDVKHRFGDSRCQAFSPSGLQQVIQNAGPDSLSYIQEHVPHMHLKYGHSSDQMSVCMSGCKSENNGHPSSSPNDCSYVSNVVQSVESIHGPAVEASAMMASEKRERMNRRQDLQASFSRNFKHANMMAFSDPVSVQKQIRRSEPEIKGYSEVEGMSVVIPAELDLSNAQESCCASSVLDEISLEATSFRQLQQITEQMDIRTKLCIRDSLYRLARSAEQRHKCMNPNVGTRDDRDASGALRTEEKNKCTGFMDIETDTNPIDRSIAHLLFHRPSDPSATPMNDSISFKSHGMIDGSSTSPPVMAEKQEETVAGTDKKMITNNKELASV